MIPTIWFFYGNKTAQKIKLKNGKVRLVGTKKPNEVERVLSQINLSD